MESCSSASKATKAKGSEFEQELASLFAEKWAKAAAERSSTNWYTRLSMNAWSKHCHPVEWSSKHQFNVKASVRILDEDSTVIVKRFLEASPARLRVVKRFFGTLFNSAVGEALYLFFKSPAFSGQLPLYCQCRCYFEVGSAQHTKG